MSQETIYKVGSGKKAAPALILRKYETVSGDNAYLIYHPHTNTTVGCPFVYASTGRHICKNIIEELGEAWLESDRKILKQRIPDYVVDYIQFYEAPNANKTPLSIEEFRAGPEYETLQHRRATRDVDSKTHDQLLEELSRNSATLAYVSHRNGKLYQHHIDALFRGRPFPREAIYSPSKRQGSKSEHD